METTTTMNVAPVPCVYGGHGYGFGYNNQFNGREYNECDIRHDIVEVQSELKDSITALSNKTSADSLNLHNRLCESEKDSIKAGYESRLEMKQSTKETHDKISLENDKVRVQLNEFERSVNDKFCQTNDHISAVERRANEKFFALREQALEMKNQDLRDALNRCKICKCVSEAAPGHK